MSSLTKELTLVDILAKIGKWFYILLFLFMTVVPIIWLTISSFKTNFEFETQPFSLPSVWQFQNYAKAIQMGGLPRLFLNSVIVAVSTTGLNILVSAMGAFAIAREKFRFNEALLNVILAGVLIPIIALMSPISRSSAPSASMIHCRD